MVLCDDRRVLSLALFGPVSWDRARGLAEREKVGDGASGKGKIKGTKEGGVEERDGLGAEIADEHGRRFGYGRDGVFLDDGVGRQDAFGEALDHGAREAEVLRGGRLGAVSGAGVESVGGAPDGVVEMRVFVGGFLCV